MTIVFMFPGQSSKYPAMIGKLCELHSGNRALLNRASEILSRDLAKHFRPDNTHAFERNRDVQVGVFLATQMFLATLDDVGTTADLSLGLSLGEFSHLVHIGALDFEQALRTVDFRGALYDEGPRGAMVSVFPLPIDELQAYVDQVREVGVVEIVNLNSPQQNVISGEQAAVDAAVRIIEAESFASAVYIERQVPMHCSMFQPVGERFREHLSKLRFQEPRLPYLPNRLGTTLIAPRPESFVDLLVTHVYMPVLWKASVDHLVQQHPDAVFVEVGPMAVLYNLLDRKWHRNVKYCTDSAENIRDHLDQVIASLARLCDGKGRGERKRAGLETHGS